MIKLIGEEIVALLRIAERNGTVGNAIVVAETWIKGAETEIHNLKQVIREASGDLLRGDTDGAYEALKKAVEGK